MARKVRIDLSLDNTHSLSDFPVSLYSGTTSGTTTELVYANITSGPVEFEVEDSDLNIVNGEHPFLFVRFSSDGCHDEIVKVPVPRVNCELCVSFVPYGQQQPQPTPVPTATPNPTPNATNQPTPNPTNEATPNPTPNATNQPTPNPTPNPTNEATPNPTPNATPNPTPSATIGSCVCIEFTNASSGNRIGYYDDCSGEPQTITVGSNATESVCGNGNNITVSDAKLNYSINGDCVDGQCQTPSPSTTPLPTNTPPPSPTPNPTTTPNPTATIPPPPPTPTSTKAGPSGQSGLLKIRDCSSQQDYLIDPSRTCIDGVLAITASFIQQDDVILYHVGDDVCSGQISCATIQPNTFTGTPTATRYGESKTSACETCNIP